MYFYKILASISTTLLSNDFNPDWFANLVKVTASFRM